MTATASDHFYNFDPPKGDPALQGFVLFGANKTNAWHTNNGATTGGDGDGFLEITPPARNENLGVLFPLDYFTNADQSIVALPLKGFLVEADVRIGNAIGNNGLPGNGFSISYADESDPVLYWGKQGQFRGWAGGLDTRQALEPMTYNFASGTGEMDPGSCDSLTAENGTKTGVSVQFASSQVMLFPWWLGEWQYFIILDENGAPASADAGWRVHFNGKLLKQILAQPPSGPLPTSQTPDPTGADVNGLAVCPAYDSIFDQDPACKALICADINTIETGTHNDDNGSVDTLGWAHLSIKLTTNTPPELTVTYKGRILFDHFVLTNYLPFVGRLILGGSTWEINENCDIDNLHIVTYPALQAIFKGITSTSFFLNDFTLNLANTGPARVTNVSQLTLDGVDITVSPDTTVTIGDPLSTVTFQSPTNFASGSAHVARITFSDAFGNAETVAKNFTALPWCVLPASASVPASSIDTKQPGFRVQSYQTASGEPNRMYWADEQLMGIHGTNWIDFAAAGVPLTPDGQIQWNDIIDFGNSPFPIGQFPYDSSWGALGIPSLELENADNFAIAVSAYLYFPTPGTYVMGGNSDDGLRVTYAKDSHDLLGTQVPGLIADYSRNIYWDQNVGAIFVTNAGYYGFRLLYENGRQGAGLEWYFKSTPGAGATNILINDIFNNSNQTVLAFQSSSAAPPYVSYAEPPLNDDQVRPEDDFKWQLTDGATTVDSSSVVLKLNGVVQAPSVGKSGGVTTIGLPNTPGQPHALGTHVIDLIFKDSAGTNYAYNYSFVVSPPTISIGRQGNAWVITYTGTLFSSATVNGNYAPVMGASSPYTLPTGSSPSQYYRAHK